MPETAGRDVVETTAEALIEQIASVARAVGGQAGVGASEVAGQIVSRLAKDPHLIPRFMADGSSMMLDGEFLQERGCLTYMAANEKVYTPEFLAAHKQVQEIKRTEGIR
jgi:hypothetical protein